MNLHKCLLVLLFLLSGLQVQAQDNAPVKLLVGFPAGGSTDALSRLLADRLRGPLGRPVIVENRPGVAGRMATLAVKGATADEAVFMVAPNAIITQQILYPVSVLRYDLLTDLQPVAVLISYSQGMVVHPSLGVKTVREYVDWLKAAPGRGMFGNGGLGSESHFYGLELGKAINVPMSVVPYRGNGPMVTDLLGGQINAGIAATNDFNQHVRSGRLRAIGVFGSKRSALMPEIPTMVEQGYKLQGPEPWTGVWASAKMPRAEVDRMQAAIKLVLAMPDVRELLIKRYASSPDFRPAVEMDQMQRSELKYWAPIIQSSGYTPD